MSTLAIPPVARARGGSVLAAVGTAALLVALLAKDGGFFATTWGWTALLLLWLAALGLVVADRSPPLPALAMTAAFAALCAWTAASALWSTSVTRSLLETQRVLVYPAGLAALFLLARGRQRGLLAGVYGASIVIASYALATRLFPERLGVFDPVATYRLSEPVGYWNGLGLVASVGLLLALGYAARAERTAFRAAAAASLPLLACTVYFTFSRGAWAALTVGLAVTLALDARRTQLSVTALVQAPWAALAVAVASRSDALTHQGTRLADASHDGHRLALLVAVLAACSAAAAVVLARLEGRVETGRRLRVGYAAALALVALVALTGLFARYGAPPHLARDAYDRFTDPPPPQQANLNRRLFTVSSGYRNLHWRVAWDEYHDHPLLGSGAGTYEHFWLQRRTIYKNVRDAHSLYVETLAELGPVGLGLLGAGLAVPVWAAVRRRRAALVPPAAGAYSAYLVHAGVDWDWELTGVTLAALAVGGALVLDAVDGSAPRLPGPAKAVAIAAAFGLGLVALAGAVGQAALADARSATDAGRTARAVERAREARRWAPWSSEPWQALGEAQELAGLRSEARQSYRNATAKDGRDWELWLDLARVSDGRARVDALARAKALNPRSLRVAEALGAERR